MGICGEACAAPGEIAVLRRVARAPGGDPFYGKADVQPCAGHLGPGGTLPRMKVPTDAITVDGGVSTASGKDWQLLTDYEPRSFGPVSFAFDEAALYV